MRSAACVVAVVVALGSGGWPSAQAPTAATEPQPPAAAAPSQQPARPPTFRTEANFVRVDAYPIKDGKPVLGLTAADFEIAEDGVPQKIDQFEHVVVRPAGPQSDRIEPGSQREMLQAAENPRQRVFVVFLDTTHVRFEDSGAISEPLIRLINRILGPDDLVGVMTPDMSATELVLAQRTLVTEERLRAHWRWGDRFVRMNDEREDAYESCYGKEDAAPLIARKRERETLEALQDVVRYLGGVREERKAILTVTNGWPLFTPQPDLLNSRRVPTVDSVGVGRDGQLTTRNPRSRNDTNTLTRMECDTDRMRLANIDDEQFLRDLVNEANRSNATFYPIDPRGLVVFQTGAGSAVPLAADQQMRRTHQQSMLTLGDGTDGLAVTNTNDLDKGLRRIADDLASYYLLGYYSTNTRMDGGYRSLKVRVKRPGVAVRARRGYRAANPEEVARSRAAAAAPAVDIVHPVQSALEMLAGIRPDARVRLRATASPGSDLFWIAGELSPEQGRPNDWAQGGTADLQITSGAAAASARIAIKPGDRAFLTSVKLPPGAGATTEVQARVSSPDGEPATATLHVSSAPQPLFYRRGPATANRQVATADVRFTRADRAHLELPVGADVKPAAGRLLDRNGQATAVPVALGERLDESTGQRWITADVLLASLAPGDYVVELGMATATAESRVVTGIRIVR